MRRGQFLTHLCLVFAVALVQATIIKEVCAEYRQEFSFWSPEVRYFVIFFASPYIFVFIYLIKEYDESQKITASDLRIFVLLMYWFVVVFVMGGVLIGGWLSGGKPGVCSS
jgi:hypothetical protein